MKVIFLDIDGVLCTQRSHAALGEWGTVRLKLDPIAIGLIDRLLDVDPATRVVISSTWRKDGYDRVLRALTNEGFRGSLHEDWCTPKLRSGFRGDEVKAWLAKHPEVTGYVCIDDDSDFYPDQPVVRTTDQDGFLYENFLKTSEILFGKPGAWFDAMKEFHEQADDEEPLPDVSLNAPKSAPKML